MNEKDKTRFRAKRAAEDVERWKKSGKVPLAQVASFLLDSGLLFEFNRTILHPLGLALSVTEYPGGVVDFSGISVDKDPEGTCFGPESLEEGRTKLEEFLLGVSAAEKQALRTKAIGYVKQPLWDYTDKLPKKD
jgi:hypothetical protein